MTSLALLFEELPEQVWKTSIGKLIVKIAEAKRSPASACDGLVLVSRPRSRSQRGGGLMRRGQRST